MRHRIRDIVNTVVEVAADLGWDLAIQYVTHSKAIVALQQRMTDLEHLAGNIQQAIEARERGRRLVFTRDFIKTDGS